MLDSGNRLGEGWPCRASPPPLHAFSRLVHTRLKSDRQDVSLTLPNGEAEPQAAAPSGGAVYRGGYFNSGIPTQAPFRGRYFKRAKALPSALASASASPPTLTSHSVAAAMTTHKRAARSGSLIRVACHGQPPRMVSLNPRSIQIRSPYQHGSQEAEARSVRINQGFWWPSSQRAGSVQARGHVEKAVPLPNQLVPVCGAKVSNATKR